MSLSLELYDIFAWLHLYEDVIARTLVAVGFSAVPLIFICNHYCTRQIAV